jgi:hypothetical protein
VILLVAAEEIATSVVSPMLIVLVLNVRLQKKWTANHVMVCTGLMKLVSARIRVLRYLKNENHVAAILLLVALIFAVARENAWNAGLQRGNAFAN